MTSDFHLGHLNIIKYCNRPFSSVEEMDQEIIRRCNELVKPDDTLYFLGDWALTGGAFKKPGLAAEHYRRQIRCNNIILIWGNHDKKGKKDPLFQAQFKACHDFLETYIEDQRYTLCHYALKVWNKSHHGAFHLYGHSHGTLPDDPNSRSFDCGVDCHNFYPISHGKVKEIMERKTWVPKDHHNNETME